MAANGTILFSHILPVILGFLAIILVISGSLEESKAKLGVGIVLFVVACLFPYMILSVLI